HTLADLHYAIQHAFDWDADHLYSFYLTNNRAEKHYAIHCPELDENWDFTVWSITSVDMRVVPTSDESNTPVTDLDLALEDEGLDEGGEIYTTNTRIGALGLVNKHSFMYFFDYGDNHEFTVTVIGSERESNGHHYPRVIDSQGQAPAQYYSYTDQDADEDE
ncbi:MAG: plasmid pRiA4b ORF-3 family protein, partial [Oscillochloris sp.]|nr:plasmid pRiA4b ORF-3 family protein [Oscillochloris sp.]